MAVTETLIKTADVENFSEQPPEAGMRTKLHSHERSAGGLTGIKLNTQQTRRQCQYRADAPRPSMDPRGLGAERLVVP